MPFPLTAELCAFGPIVAGTLIAGAVGIVQIWMQERRA